MSLSKKFISAILTLTMILSITIPSMAKSERSSTHENTPAIRSETTSEYNMICKLQACPEDKLSELGYSAKEIADIQEFDYEQALYERAQLPIKALKNLGYSKEQIKFLKNYDGSALNSEEINLMSAEMSEKYYAIWPDHAGTTKITCHYYWEWDTKPLLYGTAITDKVVVSWAGADASGNRIMTNYICDETKAVSNYYKDGKLLLQKEQEIASPNMTGSVYTTIKAGYMDAWAKSGDLMVSVEPTSASKEFGFVCFTAAYVYHCSGNDFFDVTDRSLSDPCGGVSLHIRCGSEKNKLSIVIYQDGSYYITSYVMQRKVALLESFLRREIRWSQVEESVGCPEKYQKSASCVYKV